VTLKLGEVRTRIWRWMHEAVALQQRRINRLLARHYEYYGVSGDFRRLNSFTSRCAATGTASWMGAASGA
jgi:hypothetical protein